MRRILVFTILTIAMLASCKEYDNILEYKNAGVLNILLNDAKGAPIADAKLIIQGENDEAGIALEAVSDAKGVVSFGELTPGAYILSGHNIVDGEHTYDIQRGVQVVQSETKEIPLVPSSYRTTLVMSITEYIDSATPLGKDVKVALVQLPTDKPSLSFEEASERIVQEYTADGITKEFTFKDIPINNYRVMVYTSSEFVQMFMPLSSHIFKKDGVKTLNKSVHSKYLRLYEFNQPFKVTQRVKNASTGVFEDLPFEGCSVFIVNPGDYMTSNRTNFKSISAAALASIVTDVNGEASLKLRGYRTYNAVCFAPDETYIGVYRIYPSQEVPTRVVFKRN